MTSATRLAVHRSFNQPCAVAPCDSRCSSLFNWSVVSFGWRPPPGLRARSGRLLWSCPSNSLRPRQMVGRLSPVMSDTSSTPPQPMRLDSNAATHRRCRSFKWERRRLNSRCSSLSGWSPCCKQWGHRHRCKVRSCFLIFARESKLNFGSLALQLEDRIRFSSVAMRNARPAPFMHPWLVLQEQYERIVFEGPETLDAWHVGERGVILTVSYHGSTHNWQGVHGTLFSQWDVLYPDEVPVGIRVRKGPYLAHLRPFSVILGAWRVTWQQGAQLNLCNGRDYGKTC
jgi:hypothetical protein